MATQEDKFILYYNPYSICSLMVLYTLAVTKAEDELNLEKKLLDIFHEEQFTEHFLCDINDHGQVSCLIPLLYMLLLTTQSRSLYCCTQLS